MLKIELIKENGKLKNRIESFESNDRYLRSELTKCLGYIESNFNYASSCEILTWEQVFFKIGLLKKCEENSDVKKRVKCIYDEFSLFKKEFLNKREAKANPKMGIYK